MDACPASCGRPASWSNLELGKSAWRTSTREVESAAMNYVGPGCTQCRSGCLTRGARDLPANAGVSTALLRRRTRQTVRCTDSWTRCCLMLRAGRRSWLSYSRAASLEGQRIRPHSPRYSGAESRGRMKRQYSPRSMSSSAQALRVLSRCRKPTELGQRMLGSLPSPRNHPRLRDEPLFFTRQHRHNSCEPTDRRQFSCVTPA